MYFDIDKKYLDEPIFKLGLPSDIQEALIEVFEECENSPIIGNVEKLLPMMHQNLSPCSFYNVVTAYRKWISAHKKESEQTPANTEFEKLMYEELVKFDLTYGVKSSLTYNHLVFVGDIVKLSKAELYSKRIAEESCRDVVREIRTLGLDLRPEDLTADEWILMLKAKFIANYEKEHPTMSSSTTKPALPKKKISKQAINAVSDKQLLQAVVKDISVIKCLEESFITQYSTSLISIILADTKLDTDKKLELIEFINNAQTHTR